MKFFHPLHFLLLGTVAGVLAADDAKVSGNAVFRRQAGPSEIVITTTDRLAGAIHSLTWNGKEFIDSADHGRQLQSASSFGNGGGPFIAETFNPTEAGSRRDGAGPTSSSKLLRFRAGRSALESTTQMAFWLAPGEKTPNGHPARNAKVLSDHLLERHVQIGCPDMPHAIQYDVTFVVPDREKHDFAQFEALTGYMPKEFSRFWKLEPGSDKRKPLDDGPGEQTCPVILATENGSHAMGICSPDQPPKGFQQAGYGRFRFRAAKVNKWNCVFRMRDEKGIAPGRYSFRLFVAVGSLDDVQRTIAQLSRKYRRDR